MAVEVASAYVTLLPSIRGFGRQIEAQTAGELDAAGRSGGRRFGAGMSSTARAGGKNFAKVLGVGLLGGVGVALAGFGAVLKTGLGEAMDASAGTAQLAAGIKSTGNAAGVSVKGINDLASSIEGYSGQTDDSIVASAKLLLTFTNIKNKGPDKIFDLATQASADMAAKMGGDASASAIQLGKALNDPVKGVGALSRVGVSFTAAQKTTIKAMVKSGNVMGAQKIILKELNTEFGGAAKAAGESLPGQLEKAKRSFEGVSQSVVEGLLPLVLPGLTSIGTVITDTVMPGVKAMAAAFVAGGDDVTSSGFAGGMERIGLAARKVVDFFSGTVVPGVRALIAAFQAGGDDVTSSGFAGGMERIGLAARKVVDFLSGTVIPAIRQLVGGFTEGTDALGSSQTQFAVWGAVAFEVFNRVKTFIVTQVVPALMRIVDAIRGFIAVALPIVKAFVAGMMARIQPLMPKIKAIFTTIGTNIMLALELIRAVIARVTTVIKFIWDRWGNSIMDFIAKIWAKIMVVIQAALNIIKGIIKTVTSLIKGDWSGVWDGIKTILAGVWDGIKGIIRLALTVVKGLLSGAWGLIKAGASLAWDGIKKLISLGWEGIKTVFRLGIAWIVDKFLSFGQTLIDGAARIFGWIPGIGGKLRAASDAFAKFRNDVNAALGGIKDQTVSVKAVAGFRIGTGTTLVSTTNAKNKLQGMLSRAAGGPALGAGTGTSDSIPTWLSNGEHVWTAAEVRNAGGHGAVEAMRSRFRFARGGGVTLNAKALGLRGLQSGARGFGGDISSVLKLMSSVLQGQLTPTYPKGVGGSVGAGVKRWAATVLQALARVGQPSSLLGVVLRRMNQESGGNPRAINLWDCVTLDTMILTRHGWLKHDEVQVGDETIGYNLATGRSEWTTITRVVHYSDAPLTKVGNSRWHATTTPNHRWVTAPRESVAADPVADVCDLCDWPADVRRRGQTTTGGLRIHRAKAHGIAQPKRVTTNGGARMVSTEEIRSRDRLILSAVADTGDGLPISDVEAEILGWLAGDGHVESGRRGASMSISQSKPAMVVKLRALLSESDVAVYVDERLTRTGKQAIGPRHVFRFRPAYRRDLLGRAGHPKTDAESMVLRMSASQRAAWLNGFIDAEGHRNGGYVNVSQTYGPVLEAAHLAIYLCGYRPHLVDDKVRDPNWSPCAHISLTRPVVSGSFLTREDAGSGDVWCVTTDLGTWTAEQDGQFFLTGNSNAKAGIPSKGLLQTIDPTFQAYRDRALVNDVYNPFANIVASLRYTMSRYGSVAAGYNRAGGYDQGGFLPPGLSTVYNGTGRPEPVLTPRQWDGVKPGAGKATEVNFYGNVGWDADEVARRIATRQRDAAAMFNLGVA